ncbi:MAG: hypothetical protein U9O53_02195, partial [archaeon]|nr:hypothetical protein [archaeon]
TNHYGMIGTAFEYLMGFNLKYHNPDVQEKTWVAEASCILTEVNPSVHKKAVNNLNFAKDAYSEFLKDGVFNKDILKGTILLAQLDPIYRAGHIDENMGVVDNNDIQDLRNLISLVNIEDFKVDSYCLLNPTFGEGSVLVGGADADLVIDNQMIDIKTTKKLEVTRKMFNQIIVYYILGYIGGIGAEKIDISNIDKIGFYFSRYEIKYMYDVKDIINFDSLPYFIDILKEKAEESFPVSEISDRMVEKIYEIIKYPMK